MAAAQQQHHLFFLRRDMYYQDTYYVFSGSKNEFEQKIAILADQMANDPDDVHCEFYNKNSLPMFEGNTEWHKTVFNSQAELEFRILKIPSDFHYFGHYTITNIMTDAVSGG
jgi:hypothetical protein